MAGMTADDMLSLIKVAATVVTATVGGIGLISKPLWSKLNRMEASIDQKINAIGNGLDDKLTTISNTVDGIKARVSEQNGRIGKMETWQTMHEEHDNERHEETLERRKELLGSVTGLRDDLKQAVSDLREEISRP